MRFLPTSLASAGGKARSKQAAIQAAISQQQGHRSRSLLLRELHSEIDAGVTGPEAAPISHTCRAPSLALRNHTASGPLVDHLY